MTIFIYTIAEIISLIFMFLAQKYKQKDKKLWKFSYSTMFFILSLLPFLILIWFRDISVGTDYKRYSEMYLKIVDGTLTNSQSKWLGVTFKMVCKFLAIFCGRNYILAFSILNTITVYLIHKAIYDRSDMTWLSLAILYAFCLHFQIFNQFRQMFAIALCFYAIKYLETRKVKQYVACILIATLFHNTAIIMLPVYWLVNIKINKKTIIMYIGCAALLYFGYDILKLILLNTDYGQRYFAEGIIYNNVRVSSIINFIIRLILLVGCMLFYKKSVEKNEKNKYLYSIVIFCTILQVLTLRSYVFARLTTYFYIFYVLLLPEVLQVFLEEIKPKYHNYMIILTILALIIYQYVYYNSDSGADTAGYKRYTLINKNSFIESKEMKNRY